MPVASETEPTSHVRSAASPVSRAWRLWIIYALLVAGACAWILHLPLFPSQDGAVHVYYARVSSDLLFGPHRYEHDFRVARPFPPYALHAYLLMALLRWTSSEMAEQLLACIAVVSCAIGLGYFSRQLGRSAWLAAPFALPFFLNRWLFFGFYGYLIGVGVALLAMGVWLRDDRHTPLRRAAFLFLTLFTLFSHPVPYLLLVAFGWSALLSGWWNRRSGTEIGTALQAPSRGDILTMAAASALFVYIKMYSHSGMLWNYELLADVHDKLMRIVDVFRAYDEMPLQVPVYNAVLGGILVVATIAVCWQSRRESKMGLITRTQFVVGWAFLILIALPFLPRTMNGSGFFAARFSIWPPLLLFAAASSLKFGRRAERTIAVTAVALFVFTVVVLNTYIAPIAREVDVSSMPKGALTGEHVFTRNDSWTPTELTFVPYEYAAVRIVDHAGAFLVDSPWLDLQIMMLEELGPKIKFDREWGPRDASGPPRKIWMISARCGASGGNDTMASRIATRRPEGWRKSRFGCFEVLEPLP
jgi:hypothetical protein